MSPATAGAARRLGRPLDSGAMREGSRGGGGAPAPARKASRSATVTDALRSDIVSGAFAPGERLTEDRLGDRYGVSRIPVREALRSLEAEGFVVREPYRGARVAELSPEDAMDLLEVRQTLEEVATRRATLRRPWDAIEKMAHVLDEGRQAIVAGRLDELVLLNTELHMTLIAASGNRNLVLLYEQIRAKAQWVYSIGLDERAGRSWGEHEALVAAVASGDADLAAKLARQHVAEATHHFADRAPAGGAGDGAGRRAM